MGPVCLQAELQCGRAVVSISIQYSSLLPWSEGEDDFWVPSRSLPVLTCSFLHIPLTILRVFTFWILLIMRIERIWISFPPSYFHLDSFSSPRKSPLERSPSQGRQTVFRPPAWNRLRSSCLVIRVDDLDIHQVRSPWYGKTGLQRGREAAHSLFMSLLFNMLCRFVIAFLPRSKHLLISWLQSASAMTLSPRK